MCIYSYRTLDRSHPLLEAEMMIQYKESRIKLAGRVGVRGLERRRIWVSVQLLFQCCLPWFYFVVAVDAVVETQLPVCIMMVKPAQDCSHGNISSDGIISVILAALVCDAHTMTKSPKCELLRTYLHWQAMSNCMLVFQRGTVTHLLQLWSHCAH